MMRFAQSTARLGYDCKIKNEKWRQKFILAPPNDNLLSERDKDTR